MAELGALDRLRALRNGEHVQSTSSGGVLDRLREQAAGSSSSAANSGQNGSGVLERLREQAAANTKITTPGRSGAVGVLDRLRKEYGSTYRSAASYSARQAVEEYNKLYSDYRNFTESAQKALEGAGYTSAAPDQSSFGESAKQLREKSEALRATLRLGRSAMGEEGYQSMLSNLDEIGSSVDTTMGAFNNNLRYASRFNSEEAYNTAIDEQKTYQEKVNFDQEAGAREIRQMERELQDFTALTRAEGDAEGRQRAESYRQKYGSPQELEKLISRKKAFAKDAARIQGGIALAGVADSTSQHYDPEFERYAQDGARTIRGLMRDFVDFRALTRAESDEEGRQRAETYRQKYGSPQALEELLGKDMVELYDQMTEEELATYGYHYSKNGKQAAQDYLDSIKEELNKREAEKEHAANYKDDTLAQMAFGVAAGLDQFGSNVKNLFNGDDYIPTSKNQYLSGMVREDLADNGLKLPELLGGSSLGQVAYDAINTTANMAPSILASMAVGAVSKTAGSAVGLGLMGASAAGGAYQEKLNQGYTKAEAGTYAAMVGASEVVLEKVLGGITQVGGKALGKTVLKGLSQVDNVLGRVAKKVGSSTVGKIVGSGLSEAVEEGLQTILEPVFWNVVSGEEIDVEKEEVLYSALLGAVTGVAFEGADAIPDAVRNAKANRSYGKAVTAVPGAVEALKQTSGVVGQELGGNAQKGLEKLSEKVGDQQTGGVTARIRNMVNTQRAGKLYRQTAEAVSELNARDIASALHARGWDWDKATAVGEATADALTYAPNQEQYRLLEKVVDDPVYQEAVKEVSREDRTGTVDQRLDRLAAVKHGRTAQTATADGGNINTGEQAPAHQVYDIDTVNRAAQEAVRGGKISQQAFNDVQESLAYAQSDMAEGNITEDEYHERLNAVMESFRPEVASRRAILESVQTKVEQDVWDEAQRMARAVKRDVVLYNGPADENGVWKDGKIYINTNAKDPFAGVFGHEMTHSLEQTKNYDRLNRFVMAELARQSVDMAQLRSAKLAQYRRHGVELKTNAEIDREIVAEFVQKNLLTDEQSIYNLVRTDRNLAQRAYDWIRNTATRIFGNKQNRQRARLEHAAKIYAKALKETWGTGTTAGSVRMGSDPAAQTDTFEARTASMDEAYRRGELSEEDYDAAMDAMEQDEEERLASQMGQYSFAGEKAQNADLDALETAKTMQQAGVADETIRQQTGWFMGRDGKWRWEIDDSRMQYSRRGDLGFRERNKGYDRYRTLTEKAERFMLELSDEQLTDDEAQELKELREIYSGTFRQDGRISPDALPQTKLSNYLKHDDLFEAYPQLRNATLRFANLSDGTRGQYDPSRDEIILSESLRRAPEDSLIHEVQHAIQDAEGFSGGASVEYWKEQQKHKEIAGSMTPSEQYYKTAGEIEARDTANRRTFTADERKNTPPDLGGEDTVFVDQLTTSSHAIGRTVDNNPFVTVASDILSGVKRSDWVRTVKQNLKNNYPNGIVVGRNNIRVDPQSRRELTYSGYMQWLRKHDPQAYADKLRATDNADEILLATTDWINEGLNHPRKDKIVQFARGNLLIRVGNSDYAAKVVVATESDGQMKLYDILDIKRTTIVAKEMDAAKTANPSPGAGRNTASISTDNISQSKQSVKGNDAEQFSFSDTQTEEEKIRRPLEGWYDTDEKALQARKKGYPVLHGEQIVPFNTWVKALDRGNYGLVTGMAPDGKLLVSFHNKHDGSMADNVALPADQLMPVPGAYQMTKEEFASLMASEPLDIGNEQFSEEDMRAIEELYRRSGSEEKSVQPVDLDKLPPKAQRFVKRAKNSLLKNLANRLGVSKFVDRSHLQEAVDEIAQEYLQTGTVADEKLDELFEKVYERSVMVDREFYDRYKDIKARLRSTAVTLSEADRADIADFGDFRKRNSFLLRITNQNGIPVDSFYEELRSLAPELFPEEISHPADQLIHMAEVARSIAVSEQTLSEYYGPQAAMYKGFARNEFAVAAGDMMGRLYQVRRYADAQKAQAAREKAPMTVDEAMDVYGRLKKARRVCDRAVAKNLLTYEDEVMVGKLLRHELELQHLDSEKYNVEGITAVYKAKAEYEELCRQIREYRQYIKRKLRDEADGYLETANQWKDKNVGILYSRETMRRNIYDIVKDRVLAKRINEAYFESVHEGEAKATRMKNQYRDRIRKLELSRKVQRGNLVSEAHAVQLLGEAEDNIRMLKNSRGMMKSRDGKTLREWQNVVTNLWLENPGLDEGKIRGAVEEFRKIYDELFRVMNRVRVENGYEPINYRNGYFPHFQPDTADGVLALFGKALGIDTQVVSLPTTINGLTHTFRPGIRWFGNAQERLGFNTAYDAVEGFDKYIEGAAGVIFQTENIQRLRALATQIRYRTSEEGIQEQVDAVNADDRLTDDEKQIKIKDIFENGKYSLGNFVAELDEYTNLLANKKSKYDRSMEAMMGRKAYTVMKWMESRVGANMIAGNLSSALTNFIPLTQAAAQIDSNSFIRGAWDALRAVRDDDGLIDRSAFLTNRRGSDPLVRTGLQKVSEIAGLPMEIFDQFTSEAVVRGAYYQNLKRGMSETEALHEADIFAANVMADRSKGSMPTIMEASNPLLKMLTQFQLEVNNQFSEVFKDLPRNHKERGVLALAGVIFKYFLFAFAFNELFEVLFGRRPALDPIGLLLEAGEDFVDPNVGFGEGITNLSTSIAGELPFNSGLGLLGIENDGSRVPVASAIPSIPDLWNAATNNDWHWKKRLKEAGDELAKPLTYLALPFGGNQIAKTWKGIKAVIDGGSYSVDAKGNEILQYPVYNDSPWDALRAALQGSIMGKSSLKEARDWVDKGFDSLGVKETATYKGMLEAGVNDREAYGLIRDVSKAKESEGVSAAQAKRKVLWDSGASGEAKALVYYGLIADHDSKAEADPEIVSEREFIGQLFEQGADPWEVTKAIMGIKDANALEGAEKSCAKRDAIADAALTQDEQVALFRRFVSEKRADDVGVFLEAGLDFDSFVEINNRYARIEAMDIDTQSKANTLAHWVDQQGYTNRQKELIKDTFVYYISMPANPSGYDKFTASGLSADEAFELAEVLDDLEPLAGTDKVTDVQRWRACVDMFSNEATQLAALAGRMSEDQFAKVDIAHGFGVSPRTFVNLKETLPKFDKDGSGTLNQSEVAQAINSMIGLSTKQKAVLWQISGSSWSEKSNPFSTSVGKKVKNEVEKRKGK